MTDGPKDSDVPKDPKDRPPLGSANESELAEHLGAMASRKLNARRKGQPGVWFGLGMMGLIGWSVSVPTLLGAMLGIWIDQHYSDGRSWTLALLVAGLSIGCLNAWRWISQEDRAMRDEQSEKEVDDAE